MNQLKWVWEKLGKNRKWYVCALIAQVFLSMAPLVNSSITARIMDTVFYPVREAGMVTPELWSRLVFLACCLVGFVLFRTSFAYLVVMTFETCSQKLLFGLRRDLYANMQAQVNERGSRLSTIKNSDRILYISNKGIAESGTHDSLLQKKGYYYQLYTAQLEG